MPDRRFFSARKVRPGAPGGIIVYVERPEIFTCIFCVEKKRIIKKQIDFPSVLCFRRQYKEQWIKSQNERK